MLQIMSGQEDKKKYPTLSARISEDFEKKFDDLLKYVQRENPIVDKPILLRMLVGADTRIAYDPAWRDFLSGVLDSLPEVDQPPRSGRGFYDAARRKRLGRGKKDD
jgi:hypothetical protein